MSYLVLFKCKELKILGTRKSSTGLVSKDLKSNLFKRKVNEIVKWYEEVTGMDEVRLMQNRVLEAQDKFVVCQEKRRIANKELASVQSKLKDIYSELDTTSRGEERYLHLVTHEHVLLKEEKKILGDFATRERDERESFAMLSACVKESHEKERAQAERTKYWSVIGSVLGTIIGIVASSVSNEFKMKELRLLVNTANKSPEFSFDVKATQLLVRHEQQLSSLINDMKSIVHKYSDKNGPDLSVIRQIDQLLHSISNKQSLDTEHYIEDSVQKLHQSIEEVKALLAQAQRYDGQLIAIPADMESVIRQQKKETRTMLTAVAILSFIVPVIILSLQRL